MRRLELFGYLFFLLQKNDPLKLFSLPFLVFKPKTIEILKK